MKHCKCQSGGNISGPCLQPTAQKGEINPGKAFVLRKLLIQLSLVIMPQCINNVSTHIIYHIHLLPFSLTQQSLNSMETRKESIIKRKSFPFTKTGHHLEHQFLTFKSKKYIKYCFFLITTMLTFLFQHTTSFAMVLTGVFLWHSSKNHNHSTTGGQQHEDLTFGVMVQRPHQSSFVNTSSWLMNGKYSPI